MRAVDTPERAPIDVCDECGFRWDEYDDETAVNALRLHPGWSRLYATVLRLGTARTGDLVVVEPER